MRLVGLAAHRYQRRSSESDRHSRLAAADCSVSKGRRKGHLDWLFRWFGYHPDDAQPGPLLRWLPLNLLDGPVLGSRAIRNTPPSGRVTSIMVSTRTNCDPTGSPGARSCRKSYTGATRAQRPGGELASARPSAISKLNCHSLDPAARPAMEPGYSSTDSARRSPRSARTPDRHRRTAAHLTAFAKLMAGSLRSLHICVNEALQASS